MLKIGEFSKLSRVSVRMLRHYDEIGLLKPAEIDRFTDYRFYREDQLPIAGRIAALKDMGFSLADIVRILEVYDDREKLEQFFSVRQEELEALSKDTAYKLMLLDAARKRLRKEENMSYNVTLKTIPERYAATIRMTIPRYEDEGMIWGKLAEETCRIKDIENDAEETDMQTMELHNGVKMPAVGYGTWQSPDSEITVEGVKTAVSCGYRHIDAAAVYGNEQSVGKGIAECGIPREELFITSKVWNTERGYEKTLTAFEKTLKDLGVSYLDLYLIHWPAASHMFDNWEEINLETWRAMTELYKAGKIKAIGVSNFKPHHLKVLMETEVKPMVNQIEFHPGLLQEETVKYCRENNILVEAWSPLGTGRMLNNPLLMEIAEKYGKSVAQICIRWVMQHDVLPLPKSVTPSRIEENLKVFDFEITADDMKKIDELDNFGGSGLDPDKVDF